MNQVALETGAARRRELALGTMLSIKADSGIRHAMGVALIAVGSRIAGGMPATAATLQTNAAGSDVRGA